MANKAFKQKFEQAQVVMTGLFYPAEQDAGNCMYMYNSRFQCLHNAETRVEVFASKAEQLNGFVRLPGIPYKSLEQLSGSIQVEIPH